MKQKYIYKMKGTPGFKLLRKMFRQQGPNETIGLMGGINRGKRFHEGYAKMGEYTREGFLLSNPSKKGGKK